MQSHGIGIVTVWEAWRHRDKIRIQALEDARDAMCKWCAKGYPADEYDSHRPPFSELPRHHANAKCEATPIRNKLKELHALSTQAAISRRMH